MTVYLTKSISNILIVALLWGCGTGEQTISDHDVAKNGIVCKLTHCSGTYSGPEFIDGSDVAHQFSNQMANQVGQKLKASYLEGHYLKVDLKNIKMVTENMDNKGEVIYSIHIPFLTVSDSCRATTAFDHRGGWGHQISEKLVKHTFRYQKHLEYEVHQTPEGLQEFWIQWQHQDWQKGCF